MFQSRTVIAAESVEALLRQLTHKEYPVQIDAIQKLGGRADYKAQEALADKLATVTRNDNLMFGTLVKALRTSLSRVPCQGAIEKLGRLLEDGSQPVAVHIAAASSLSGCTHSAAFAVLRRALDSRNAPLDTAITSLPIEYVVDSLQASLKLYADNETLGFLLKRLDNGTNSQKYYALSVFEGFRDASIEPVLHTLIEGILSDEKSHDRLKAKAREIMRVSLAA